MPHLVLDCSESILRLADPDALLRSVYAAAESTGLFARSGVGGIKVRLNPYRHYVNVDNHEHFVHVFAHLMEGRTQEQKRQLSAAIVRTLKELLPSVDILSVNVRDFEKATYGNASTVEHVEGA
jgi:5-carboxymethyl-2-hydroxymuconate isomerase